MVVVLPDAKADATAGTLAGGVVDRHRVVEDEAELEHPDQDQQEDRHEHRELDEALAALAARGRSPRGACGGRVTGPAPCA